mgnify:CR=1 FL=1
MYRSTVIVDGHSEEFRLKVCILQARGFHRNLLNDGDADQAALRCCRDNWFVAPRTYK